LVAILTASLAGCGDDPGPPSHLRVAGAQPEQGRALIHAYGCGTCHTIDGVRGARGTVGPPLDDYAKRNLVAGILPNTPQALIAWLINPVALDPQTGMPAMGISEGEARHMAAYLYTLGASQAVVYPNDPPLKLRGRERPVPMTGDNPVGGPDPADRAPGGPAAVTPLRNGPAPE